MSVTVVDDNGDTLERRGACNKCGRCCNLFCTAFSWKSLRLIKKGEEFQAGTSFGAMEAVCNVFSTNTVVGACNAGQRDELGGFPFHPVHTPSQCGFYWVKISP